MSDTDPLKGKDPTLERWPGERVDHHRALLLWAMQDPTDRSYRAVARAMGVTDTAVRQWRGRKGWEHRIVPYGDEVDQVALDLYRVEYLADYGRVELPKVAQRVVRPMGPTDIRDPAARARHEAKVRVATAIPRAMAESEQAVAQAIVDHRTDRRKDAQRHIRLVDASLGLIARKLQADEVKVSVRDIPVLLDTRDRLVHVVTDTHEGTHGPVVESARVKHAKEVGGDVVTAMWEDAQELVAILGALRSVQSVDPSTLHQTDVEVRESTGTE